MKNGIICRFRHSAGQKHLQSRTLENDLLNACSTNGSDAFHDGRKQNNAGQ